MPSRPFFTSPESLSESLSLSESELSLSLDDPLFFCACGLFISSDLASSANLSAALSYDPSHHLFVQSYLRATSAPRPSCSSLFLTLMASVMPCLFLPRPSPSDQPILDIIALPKPLYDFFTTAVPCSKLAIFMVASSFEMRQRLARVTECSFAGASARASRLSSRRRGVLCPVTAGHRSHKSADGKSGAYHIRAARANHFLGEHRRSKNSTLEPRRSFAFEERRPSRAGTCGRDEDHDVSGKDVG